MKIIIAPDSFKGSLTAKEVANSIYTGLKRALPSAEYIEIPMADGGEGTMQALVDATNGKIFTKSVTGPLNTSVTAHYGISGDKETAVIEMAEAAGLQYVNDQNKNPLITTTYGVGELIKTVLDTGIRKIIVGLGGSCTNDGGAGMAQALGVKLLNLQGQELPLGGGNLNHLVRIDNSKIDPRLKDTEIILASDVTNPLTGKNGASSVFGPQKGATPEMVEELDQNLHHFAAVVRRDLNKNYENTPGAGAAGGLGFGLLTFTNATIQSGVDAVLEMTHFKEKAKGADFIFTGEGATDFQTKFGKTPYGVAKAAKEVAPNSTVICLTGNIGEKVNELYGLIDAIFATESGAKDLKQAIKDSQHDLAQISENIGRLIKNIYL
ncbi:glycerate kinase family protein [Lactobacillus paragasseri]|uniref:Glycerate kinase n=1 Tax=Lactobacillus paragasseri TaxID=2107999 RepID=A0ABD5A127_9LACO|nr:glycerate kinase [Lactobacillus paragasseri]MDK7952840.1 glycerate kinase [Lactobacillus paragasseri]MDO6361477.1 glycerate kinase [Lactobacillus paragasseri]MDX5059809.1 glycerate kinase [Lactobacillus paragasseri]